MDEARIEALKMKPLAREFEAIDRIKDKSEIPAALARLKQIGTLTPVDLDIDQDKRNSTVYAAYLSQAGLGLPDREYYLDNDDARIVGIRKKYGELVESMMARTGSKTAKQDAADIVAFETALAKINWTKVENRDPVKTYHKIAIKDLPAYAPGFDWNAYLTATGVSAKVSDVVLYQDSYLKNFAELYAKTPLPVWKAYLKWRVLRDYGRFLDKAIVDERFAFYGTTLYGIPQIRPRWQRGVQAVDDAIGEALGQVYVAKYFPPESKARMEKLVANLLAAYKQSIDGLDWMGPETKKEAHAKLAKIKTKIGYPAKWRDYSTLVIKPDDLVGNAMRAYQFEFQRNLNKLGKPIDRDEWFLTPQTVNAYYTPNMNEIVFPAAYLQPPNFNPAADDAANYGAIGRTIGHEISHAFDDSGSQYDGDGNLREWWTAGRPQALHREDQGAGRAVRRLQPGAGVLRQRQADAGREHRRPVRPGDCLQGLQAVAGRQGCAGDRRHDRRRALLPQLRAGAPREDARRDPDRHREDRSAFAGPVPRERPAVQSRCVLPDLQAQAGRQAVPRAAGARVDLVAGGRIGDYPPRASRA